MNISASAVLSILAVVVVAIVMRGNHTKDYGLGGISEQPWGTIVTNSDDEPMSTTWQPKAGAERLWISPRGLQFWAETGIWLGEPASPVLYRSRRRAHRVARRQRLKVHRDAIARQQPMKWEER